MSTFEYLTTKDLPNPRVLNMWSIRHPIIHLAHEISVGIPQGPFFSGAHLSWRTLPWDLIIWWYDILSCQVKCKVKKNWDSSEFWLILIWYESMKVNLGNLSIKNISCVCEIKQNPEKSIKSAMSHPSLYQNKNTDEDGRRNFWETEWSTATMVPMETRQQ